MATTEQRPAADRRDGAAGRPGVRRIPGPVWVLGALAVLALLVALSVAVGANPLSPRQVLAGLTGPPGTEAHAIVVGTRVPRTVLGLVVGLALGLAGALMQGLTRNPLADPGLLGVNAGAAAAIVVAVGFLGITSPVGYVWFAFAGAALVSVVVYAIGARDGATPVRLALAGAGVSAALTSFTSGVLIVRPDAFDAFRFWVVGALAGRDAGLLVRLVPFVVVGTVVALALGGALNALALGDETGRALGVHAGRTRLLAAAAVTLLCGAATAAAGPIAFVGLAVPHVARGLLGADQRRVLAFSALLGPVLLLGADVLGRVVARPGELEAGIVTAFVGAIVLVVLVRTRRVAQL